MSETKSRFKVTQEDYDDFSIYRLGEVAIATASLASDEGYWEIVVINEKDEQDVHWFALCNRPTANEITVFHNKHFNLKEQETVEDGKDED